MAIYPSPPTKGGISINTEDYRCLNEGRFLNDVIIDFYLKYVMLEGLSETNKKRTHIFSSHFYTRLAKSTVPEDRFAGVQRWTKDINIFEKDFIIIPVNEQ